MAAVSVKVGVLCIQGAFIEHVRKLQEIEQKFTKCTISIVEVRQPKDLEEIDGLIIPGGESTTLSVFLAQNDFERQMNLWLNKKKVVWGTCAGMILLSDSLEGQKKGGQIKLGGLPIECARNMFGRQLNSFEAEIQLQSADLQKVIDANGSDKCPGVFIRAPGINKLLSPEVLKLGSLTDGTIVAVQYHNIIATCFHPELTSDLRWHLYFIECILKQRV